MPGGSRNSSPERKNDVVLYLAPNASAVLTPEMRAPGCEYEKSVNAPAQKIRSLGSERDLETPSVPSRNVVSDGSCRCLNCVRKTSPRNGVLPMTMPGL